VTARRLGFMRVVGVAAVFSAFSGSVLGLELVRVVDSTAQIPGEKDTFYLDNFRPSSCTFGVVFVGHNEVGERSGLYLASGGVISTLVNEVTVVQGGTFENIRSPSCDQGRIAFSATSSLNGQSGVYEWLGGAVRVIADFSTSLPGTSHPVAGLGSPSVSGSTTSFQGLEAVVSVESLFVAVGDSFREIADTQLVLPGQKTPSYSLQAADNSDEIVFRALFPFPDFASGVYAATETGVRVVADYSTPILDRPGVYLRGFGVPRTSGDKTAFAAATTEEGQGIFVATSEGVRTLIPHLAPLPGGGALGEVVALDIDGDVLAFSGYALGEFQPRLLLWREGKLEPVVAVGEVFDGQTVMNLNFSLEHSNLAFWVLFQDSSAAIYSASIEGEGQPPAIPSLGVAGLLALATGLALSAVAVLRSSRSRVSSRR
jgi:hypothetical protein